MNPEQIFALLQLLADMRLQIAHQGAEIKMLRAQLELATEDGSEVTSATR